MQMRRSVVLGAATAVAVGTAAFVVGVPWLRSRRTPSPVPLEERLLRRQHEGMAALLARVAKGPLLPDSDDDVLAVVDQKLLQSLIGNLVPAEHVIAERFRIKVEDAWVALEDGFTLVRLKGRASLVGAESDVFAEVTVLGDLEVLRHPPSVEALPARINVVAVEAHEVSVVVPARRAKKLVEELGKLKLEDYASLASSLQIPVRQQYAFEVPAVGPAGHVRIASATVPLSLEVRDVNAFHGKLWISMATSPEPRPSEPPSLPAEGAGPSPEPASPPGVEALRAAHRAQHEELERLLARDPIVKQAEGKSEELLLVLRAEVARRVLREVARRYLDRVALEFADLQVQKEGTLAKQTFVGRLRVGDWAVNMQIHELDGVLKAGPPEIRFAAKNQIDVEIPVEIQEGKGSATLEFAWDSHGVANLVCRDFEVTERIEGVVVPEEHLVKGRFSLEAGPRSLTAQPDFPRRMRIRFDLVPASWDRLRERLRAEDRFTRCGMAMDPEKVLADLRERTERGFEISLPRKLFRTITLPAQIAESVRVDDQEVRVGIAQSHLAVTPDLLWYGAEVEVALPHAWRGEGQVASR